MTGSGGTALLGLATAVVALVSFAIVMKHGTMSPWPSAILAGATILWFLVSLPFAAIKVAHDERIGRLDAEAELQNKRPRADIKGEIEVLERLRLSVAGVEVSLRYEDPMIVTHTKFWAWLRLTNSGSSSSLLHWEVRVADKTGAHLDCSVPYSQDTMPTRSGPPATSIHGLQNSALETGRSVEVCIGFGVNAAIADMDISSLRVCFVDAWDNPYEIGPASNIQVVA